MKLKVPQRAALTVILLFTDALPCAAQSALESNQQQLQNVDQAEDGVIVRGADFAEKLWDSAKGSVEGEASKDIAALKATPTPTPPPLAFPTVAPTPGGLSDAGDSNADIEADIDQLEESAQDE